MAIDFEEFAKAIVVLLDKLNLSRAFMLFGGVGLVAAIWNSYSIGMKVSVITLIFAGFFRLFSSFIKMMTAPIQVIGGKVTSTVTGVSRYKYFIFTSIQHVVILFVLTAYFWIVWNIL
jgi:hypothetical protein